MDAKAGARVWIPSVAEKYQVAFVFPLHTHTLSPFALPHLPATTRLRRHFIPHPILYSNQYVNDRHYQQNGNVCHAHAVFLLRATWTALPTHDRGRRPLRFTPACVCTTTIHGWDGIWRFGIISCRPSIHSTPTVMLVVVCAQAEFCQVDTLFLLHTWRCNSLYYLLCWRKEGRVLSRASFRSERRA